MTKKIGKSKLNIELPIHYEQRYSLNISNSSDSVLSDGSSERNSEGNSDVSSECSLNLYDYPILMNGLLTNRKETINKIFKFLNNNISLINFRHVNDVLYITGFNHDESIVTKIEIDLKTVLKYYHLTENLNYTIYNIDSFNGYNCDLMNNNIGFEIIDNEIMLYSLNNITYFANKKEWLNKRFTYADFFQGVIPIQKNDPDNDIISSKLKHYPHTKITTLFKLSNQHINQLCHLISINDDVFTTLKYNKSKLYFNDYYFKNLISKPIDVFTQKSEIEIETNLLKNLIEIINNEKNSETYIEFSNKFLSVTLEDVMIKFKTEIYL